MIRKTAALCALPILLAACAVDDDRGSGYQAPAPQPTYVPPPPPPPPPAQPSPAYSTPPRTTAPSPSSAPPRERRKTLRSANLSSYCKSRGYTGSGTNNSGTPICVQTKMGFNTTYTAKTGGINFADVCQRQHRTSQYQVQRGRVDCVVYTD